MEYFIADWHLNGMILRYNGAMKLRVIASTALFLCVSALAMPAASAPGGTAWLPTDYTGPQLVPLTHAEKDQVWVAAEKVLKKQLLGCEKWFPLQGGKAAEKCRNKAQERNRRLIERELQPLYWQGLEHNAPIAPMPSTEDGPPKYSTYMKFTPLWEACRTEITYSVDSTLAPAKKRVSSDVSRAFQRLEDKTGYSFTPVSTGGNIQIVWTAGMGRDLKGDANQDFAEDASTTYRYDVTGGLVRINPKNDLSGARTKRLIGKHLRAELIFHELGHIMGLSDIADTRSVMKSLTSFSRADEIAFDAVGRSRCIDDRSVV